MRVPQDFLQLFPGNIVFQFVFTVENHPLTGVGEAKIEREDRKIRLIENESMRETDKLLPGAAVCSQNMFAEILVEQLDDLQEVLFCCQDLAGYIRRLGQPAGEAEKKENKGK